MWNGTPNQHGISDQQVLQKQELEYHLQESVSTLHNTSPNKVFHGTSVVPLPKFKGAQ